VVIPKISTIGGLSDFCIFVLTPNLLGFLKDLFLMFLEVFLKFISSFSLQSVL